MDNSSNIILSRLSAQQRAMEVTANNLANMSTPGYRTERTVFADWLYTQKGVGAAPGARELAFTQDRATYRERAEGTITQTGNPLDVALSGEGYFTVQTANGTRLTRAGHFTLQSDGTISDVAGNALLDTNGQPLKVAPADTKLTITADGALSSQNGPIGKIAIVAPNDPNRLLPEGNRLLRAPGPTTPVTTPRMVQGALEDSNVQPMAELVRMTSTERSFQLTTQFLEAESQRRQTAIDHITSGNG